MELNERLTQCLKNDFEHVSSNINAYIGKETPIFQYSANIRGLTGFFIREEIDGLPADIKPAGPWPPYWFRVRELDGNSLYSGDNKTNADFDGIIGVIFDDDSSANDDTVTFDVPNDFTTRSNFVLIKTEFFILRHCPFVPFIKYNTTGNCRKYVLEVNFSGFLRAYFLDDRFSKMFLIR